MTSARGGRRAPARVLAALGLLYTAQGVPFGFAAEYLPVVLREARFSMTEIAMVAWLQLPWQLKVLWAGVADRPAVRRRARVILLAVQAALALALAAYAPFTLAAHAPVWFALTALAAFVAATQDVFVDAFAVRLLGPADRGLGNVAQVAGYRLGMLAGGAGMLLLSGRLGEPLTLLGASALVAVAGVSAFALRDGDDRPKAAEGEPSSPPLPAAAVVRHVLSADALPVLALALTYKLGLHMASGVLKPMVVDAGWTRADIGWAVVSVGTVAALLGASAGGLVHRGLRERNALALGAALQAAVCVPLVLAARLGCPRGVTVFAIAVEHFASGLGTTVLFAALMSATRPANAALHYTILTSANALAIGLGSLVGGVLADHLGYELVFGLAGAACLAPVLLLARWERARQASAA